MKADTEVECIEQSQHIENLLNDAKTDRNEDARRFNEQIAEVLAQGEQIRALLSALAKTNRRIDNLERAI